MDMRHFVLRCALTLSLLTSCQRSDSGNTSEATDPPAKKPAEAPGVVQLSPTALRSLILKTAPVERRPLTEEVRVTAVIKANENRLAHVSPRIAGRVVEVRK